MWRKTDLINVLSVQFLLGFGHAFQPRQASWVYSRSGFQSDAQITFAPSPRKQTESLSCLKQTSLFSLKTLVDEVSNDSMSGTRTVFVGGKGTELRQRTVTTIVETTSSIAL